ncbi:hypothetical protein [Candidatus Poriferisocius sp.]|uniref:hypothetical protein n=1 Tax=Candidatus Poriferisocius sp. TaxID=3101276 RepID=UPI003B527526
MPKAPVPSLPEAHRHDAAVVVVVTHLPFRRLPLAQIGVPVSTVVAHLPNTKLPLAHVATSEVVVAHLPFRGRPLAQVAISEVVVAHLLLELGGDPSPQAGVPTVRSHTSKTLWPTRVYLFKS